MIFCTCSWITKMKDIPLRQLYLLSWINLIIWCISDYVYPQKLQKSDIKPTQLCCMENVIKKRVLEPLLRNSPNLERQIYELNIPFKTSIPTKLIVPKCSFSKYLMKMKWKCICNLHFSGVSLSVSSAPEFVRQVVHSSP